MSRLNRALKELQTRRPARPAVDAAVRPAAIPVRRAHRRREPRIWLILALSVAAGGFTMAAAANLLGHRPNLVSQAPAPRVATPARALPPLALPVLPSRPAPPRPVTAAAPAGTAAAADHPLALQTAAQSAPASVAASSRLGSIRTGWEPGRTRYVFKFDRWPARLDLHSGADGTARLRFARTELQGHLPEPPQLDRLLAGVSVRSAGEDIEILFQPGAGQTIEARQHRMRQAGEWPQWVVVDLRAQQPAAAPTAADRAATPTAIAEVAAEAPSSAASAPAAGGTPLTEAPHEPAPALTGETAPGSGLSISPRPPTPTRQALSELTAARRALSRGDSEAARGRAAAALDLDPDLHDARELLAGLLIGAGRIEQAAGIVEAGLARQPGKLSLVQLSAHVDLERGREEQALESMLSIAEAAADRADYRSLRATLYQRLDRHELAVVDFLAALERDRRPALWWLGLAISLEALQRLEDAAAAYGEALTRGLPAGEVRDFARDRRERLADGKELAWH